MDDYRRFRQQGNQGARNELFQGATPNYQSSYSQQQGYGQQTYGQGGYPSPYGQQQQQEEEEDVESIKTQIKTTKQESVASTVRSLQMIQQAEENAANTLNKLGEQTQRINYTERQLDLAESHAERADAQAAKLKKINGSMFGFDFSNPLTKGSRRKKELARVAAMHEEQTNSREQMRAGNYESKQRINEAIKTASHSNYIQPGVSSNRSQFQFEADEEDDQLEDQIDNNLDALSSGLNRLNAMAVASGEEVKRQTEVLERVNNKTGALESRIVVTTAKLKKIK
ncbi:hypothetical protein G9A89_007507 [Geosiphon pyriformis]|nr:hypothetical protein G9A89_007507 [Geosiphon pyriformis]